MGYSRKWAPRRLRDDLVGVRARWAARTWSARVRQRRAIEFLDALDLGEVRVVSDIGEWQRNYAGDVEYIAEGGGKVVFFRDCGSWDYVDRVELPDGAVVESFDLPDDPGWNVANWRPRHPERWGIRSDGYFMPRTSPYTLTYPCKIRARSG